MKICARSLGCAKNLVDTERFLAQMTEQGAEVIADPLQADILFLNTCAFLNDSVRESREVLNEIRAVKKRFPAKKIYLAGCLVSRFGAGILKEFPEIDRLIYPAELTGLNNRFVCTPAHYGYLKITEGCNNRCHYCLIPSLRGPLASSPPEKLLAESAALAAAGIKELNIIGHDTTAYGTDLFGKPALAGLLKELCRTKGLRWVRLLYTYPTGYTGELIDTLAALTRKRTGARLCPYLDIPFQHASDRILAAMGRRGTRLDYQNLIRRLRSAIPELALRTTFIVGLPGETEADFRTLCDFLRETKFEKAGFFAYSAEPGTPAAAFPDQVSEQDKQARLKRAQRLQATIARRRLARLIGRELQVMIDGPDPENPAGSAGRTIFDAPEVDGLVRFKRRHTAGSFVRARIIAVRNSDLDGVVARRPEITPLEKSGKREYNIPG